MDKYEIERRANCSSFGGSGESDGRGGEGKNDVFVHTSVIRPLARLRGDKLCMCVYWLGGGVVRGRNEGR